jgi:hypothetical protein
MYHEIEVPDEFLRRLRPPREWLEAKTHFAVILGDRFVF